MTIHRLKNSGAFEMSETETLTEIPSFLEKRARFVYAGKFMSMDGEVEVTKEHLEQLVGNYNSRMAKLRRLASGGKKLLGRPVQLDHTRSARDTVGRLSGDLSLEDYELEDGSKVPAVYGMVKILGKDNVERVLDGRWAELSIGADFESGEISELSVTPFPAAAEASLLSSKRLGYGSHVSENFTYKGKQWEVWHREGDEDDMIAASKDGKRVEFYLRNSEDASKEEIWAAAKKAIDKARLSEEDKSEKLSEQEEDDMNRAKLKKYLTEEKKMSDADAEKELNRLEKAEDKADLKKLSDEADEHEKKLAADKEEEDKKLAAEATEETKKKEEKLSAARANIKRLSTDFRAKATSASLSLRSAKIMHRLSGLRSSGKVTPAEIKKMNVSELAGKSDEAVEAVMKSYEDRQPVIMVGVFGSMKAMTHGQLEDVTKKKRLRQLEAESRKNFTSLSKGEEEKGQNDDEDKLSEPSIHLDTEADKGVDLAALESEFNEVCKMMDEGKLDDVKARLKTWMGRMGAGGAFATPEPTIHEESGAKLSALAADIAQLQAQFDEALGLAESLAS